jgi:RNA polymerase sigma factor (sigma-70 family)
MRRMGRLTGLQGALSLTDAQLLDRFVARRDEPAFAALMVRHGPMVLCLCRQMLRDAQEAEDAFQAAFLVLVRNANSIRKRPSLGAWLYGVAYRVAARLRGRADRRRTHEQPGVDLAALPASADPVNADLRYVLHEEVRRLPEKYRAPVVLCYLEGKTNEEAAGQLRWPVGTVKARLSRAREMMRLRLGRRGLDAAAALFTQESRSPARNTASVLPIFLFDSTIRAAMHTAVSGVGGGLATARAVGLARVVTVAMQLAKLKVAAFVVAAAFVVGAGTTSLSFLTPAGEKTAATLSPLETTGQTTAAQHPAAEPAPGDVADAKTKSDAADHQAVRPRPDDVCKIDAVQRLRELVEQLWNGARHDKGPSPIGEPRSERRPSDEMQAHPFPQQPAERKAVPDMNSDVTGCMDS